MSVHIIFWHTGSGTGAVTYSTGASTGCAVSGSILSVTNASGTCSVTATKAADANWDSAMVLMSQKMDVFRQKLGGALLPVLHHLPDKAKAWEDLCFARRTMAGLKAS